MKKSNWGLFEGHGVELEYMLVQRNSLDVFPAADRLIFQASGRRDNEAEFPDISWSNELALHVLEFKTTRPRGTLLGLDEEFQRHVQKANQILQEMGGALLPGSMHPWMDPLRETKLWPHGNREIYEAYHRLFNCQGHGWSNLQSVHLNLSFQNDEEFACLHESIRCLLPLLPTLAASSPFMEGRKGPCFDSRLWFYKDNQKKVASIIGDIIPESVLSQSEYQNVIWRPMERDMQALDPEGILEPEWLNSRAAIARFDRMSIEIRILDIQECPLADLAIVYLITEILKGLVTKFQNGNLTMGELPSGDLKQIFLQSLQEGDGMVLHQRDFLRFWGYSETSPLPVKDFWWGQLEKIPRTPMNSRYLDTLALILNRGNLSSRLLQAAGKDPDRKVLSSLYENLRSCLEKGELFLP